MNLDVTSVSKRPEQLSQTASAIQVITSEDIRRSGATSLAEALRLAPNLQIAQVNASQWAVSARGFSNVLSNKLLVLIDGRTVYTPLYAGVFWDVQNPPLESIDRIEVISGPGGALWGANAVNGVINVITKPVSETPGWSAAGSWGTDIRGLGGMRYGGPVGSRVHARAYGEAFSFGSTELAAGGVAGDEWYMFQGGARADWEASAASRITLQGDLYSGRPNPDGNDPVAARGGNVLGRWSRSTSERSDFALQLYYDRTYRDFRNGFTEDLATYDGDFHHRIQAGRHVLVWGMGARFMRHATTSLPLFRFDPSWRWLHLYGLFAQHEITLVPDRARFTLGSRFEHNDYTGWEIQPNVRFAWTPSERHTVWTAVSRAVRTPSRIDRDFSLLIAPGVPFIAGDGFVSEVLVAYELGWRFAPTTRVAVSVSPFHHEYDNLRSVEPDDTSASTLPFTFQNGVRGHSDGVEVATTFQVSDSWRLRGGYTWMTKRTSLKPGSQDANGGSAEANDPVHQVLLQSTFDLPGRLEWDAVLRYVDVLPRPFVRSYVDLDVRLGWQVTSRLEFAVTGRNLLDDGRVEFIPSPPQQRFYRRGVSGTITWR